MLVRYCATAAVWTCCCLVWIADGRAQTTHGADFDNTFPIFGYAYGYSGWGAPPTWEANDTSSQTTASYDVVTPPAATGTFDTTNWVVPPDYGYTYAGWGLGMGFFMADGFRPTSGDLSQYTISFDASVAGYAEFDDGIRTDVSVLLQVPDRDMDGGAEEVRIGVNADNLGNLTEVPLLTSTPQTISINFGDLAVLNSEYDFATDFGQTFQLLLQLQPSTNLDEIGLDNNNVLTVDNVKFSGAFGTGLLVGDYDNNGTVDGNDFLVWQRGQSPNGIDSGDLEDWKANYGQPLPAATISVVPEPGCLVLASAAALLAIAGGRRRL